MLWVFTHSTLEVECSGEVPGRTASSFSTPFALTKAVEFRPFVPAETLWACALMGLHLMAAESASVANGSQSPDFGRHVEVRLP